MNFSVKNISFKSILMGNKYNFKDFLVKDTINLKTLLLFVCVGLFNLTNAQCLVATYGLKPSQTFTPTCNGTPQMIINDAFASEYSNILVSSQTNYVLSSSVATDFITVTNENASIVFETGTSPLNFNSGIYSGVIRYYLHTSSGCGAQDTNRSKFISCVTTASTCGLVSNLSVSNVFTTNAQINWDAASPVPNVGYDFYFSTTNSISSSTVPTASVSGLNTVLSNINPGTTYYFWVRANCGDSVVSPWVAGPSFTTLTPIGAGCVTSVYGQKPNTTFTPSCTGVNESITIEGFTGEYSNVSIIPNRQYTFTSSVGTDFISVSNANATIIYASGTSPLVWGSGSNSGVIRYYFHTNSGCASQGIARTRSIKCQDLTGTCPPPTNVGVINLWSTNAQLYWTEPSPIPSPGYDIYYSTTNSISASTVPTTTAAGSTKLLSNLLPSTTYYMWIRSNCGNSEVSSWVAAPSFTTLSDVALGCTNAQYSLFPSATYTPACSGSVETITTTARASEYSNINIISNTQYTFSSSVSTDFITISTADAGTILASGTSPLVWNSGLNSGVIRYYFHTNSGCGGQNINRTKFIRCQTSASSCGLPSNLTVSNLNGINVQLNWNAAVPSPSVGYDIYYSTTNVILPTTIPVLTVTSGLATTLSGLTPTTTYYYWIRSNCQNAMVSNWVSGGSFTTTTLIGNGCVEAVFGLFPAVTFTPACTNSNEVVIVNAYAGEFSKVNIVANKQYTFTSSIPTDFITITNNAATVVYASGVSPLVWNSSTNAGVIRYYFHVNASCDSQEAPRIRYILCQDAASVCNPPSSLAFSNLQSTSVQINWNAASPVPSSGYQIYYSTTNAITPATVPTNSSSSLSFSILNLTAGTTYYYWVRSNCGSSNVGSWMSGGSFTTPPITGCITALYGVYPETTFTPVCSNTNETIVSNAYASEYSNVNVIVNKQYTFTSSITTDYITITNANATVIYASGVAPLVWNSGSNSGVIRYYFHTNSQCGDLDIDRVKYIKCANILGNSSFEKSLATIYPNPTNAIVNIVGQNHFDSIVIINSIGQVVKEFKSNTKTTQIDVSGYSSGVYLIKVSTGNKSQTFKLIKE